MSKVQYQGWRVRLRWSADGGSFEAGADIGFPESTGAMQVIEEVARKRGVDLAKCSSVTAEQTGVGWSVNEP